MTRRRQRRLRPALQGTESIRGTRHRAALARGRRRRSISPTDVPPNSPADRRNGSPSPAHWPPNRRCCCSTNRCPRSTSPRHPRCADCCATSCAATRRTAVIVTHDLLDALAIADKVIVVRAADASSKAARSAPVLTSPRSDFAARIAGVNLVSGRHQRTRSPPNRLGYRASRASVSSTPGAARSRCSGRRAVAVHLDAPHASPRNVIAVTIAEMDIHGTTVRVRAPTNPTAAPDSPRTSPPRPSPTSTSRPAGGLLRGEDPGGRAPSRPSCADLSPAQSVACDALSRGI